jgi:hypothetical protein
MNALRENMVSARDNASLASLLAATAVKSSIQKKHTAAEEQRGRRA